jgi:hypothetical protein
MCIAFARSKVDKLNPDLKFKDIITAGPFPDHKP